MPDQATQVMVIAAPPQRCFDVARDFERYPEWAADIKSVSILERDAEGRGVRVRFRAAAFGRSTSYTLQYDYSRAPMELAWVQVVGDLTKRLDGAYIFSDASTDGDSATEVTYHLVAELKLPIPGFIKRRAEGRIVHTALRELKARVESIAA
jgi:ribosome-associated toxin RatA of RatAB toxin-antitoxin module